MSGRSNKVELSKVAELVWRVAGLEIRRIRVRDDRREQQPTRCISVRPDPMQSMGSRFEGPGMTAVEAYELGRALQEAACSEPELDVELAAKIRG